MKCKVTEFLLNDSNVLLLSPTGSGKTVAFIIIYKMLQEEIATVQCLILVPSREWIAGASLEKMGTNYKVNICYGGHSIDTEIKIYLALLHRNSGVLII
jgi:superfamily II DNA/RNA helicase